MNKSDFAVVSPPKEIGATFNDKLIRELTDQELAVAVGFFDANLQAAELQFAQAVHAARETLLNFQTCRGIVNFEAQRRRLSLTVAGALPPVNGSSRA